uniref:Uncharacterized protein n=1 Tax=viral metagenome TaxID=1070528 RepID=A0A6M3KKG5_9ZZZZ
MANTQQAQSTALSVLSRVGTSLGTRALGSLAGISGSSLAMGGLFAAPLIYGLSSIFREKEQQMDTIPITWITPDSEGNAYYQADKSKMPVKLVEVPGASTRTTDPVSGATIPGGGQKLYFLPGADPSRVAAMLSGRTGQTFDFSSIPTTPTQRQMAAIPGQSQLFDVGPPTGREGERQEGINQTRLFVPYSTGQPEAGAGQMSNIPGQSSGSPVLAPGEYQQKYGTYPGTPTGGTGAATRTTGTTTTTGATGGATTGTAGGGTATAAVPTGPFLNDSQARAWILQNLGWDALQRYVQNQNTPTVSPYTPGGASGRQGFENLPPGVESRTTMTVNIPGVGAVGLEGQDAVRWGQLVQQYGIDHPEIRNFVGNRFGSDAMSRYIEAIRSGTAGTQSVSGMSPEWMAANWTPAQIAAYNASLTASNTPVPQAVGMWGPQSTGGDVRFMGGTPTGTPTGTAPMYSPTVATGANTYTSANTSGASTMNTATSATAMNRTGWEHYRERFGRYPGDTSLLPQWGAGEQATYQPYSSYTGDTSPARGMDPVEWRPVAGGASDSSPGRNPWDPVEWRPVAGGASDRAPYISRAASGSLMYYEWNQAAGQWMSRPASAADQRRVQGAGGTTAPTPAITQDPPEYANVYGPGGAPINQNTSGNANTSGATGSGYWWQNLGIPQSVAFRMMGYYQDPTTGAWSTGNPNTTATGTTGAGTTGATTATTPYTAQLRTRQRRNTMLTGGQGLLGGAPIYRPSLLGA